MFLSLYASFRWAGTEDYLVKIAAFTIIASLLSAQIALVLCMLGLGTLAFLSMILGGLSFSFPFYAVFGESRLALSPPNEFSQRIPTYMIRVPAMSVVQLVPQGFVERSLYGMGWVKVLHYRVVLLNVEIGAIPPDVPSAIGTLFVLFLLVNSVGALLGFSMRKLPLDKLAVRCRIGWDKIGLVTRVLFGVVFVAIGVWFSTIGQVVLTGPVSRYYYSYDPALYVGDAFACLLFGIIWLAIVVVEEKTFFGS